MHIELDIDGPSGSLMVDGLRVDLKFLECIAELEPDTLYTIRRETTATSDKLFVAKTEAAFVSLDKANETQI